jgi:multiple sugar transport system ATP-binding protein
MTLGHRIAVMREGALQQVAEPLTIYNRPTNLFVAGFFGSPAMNFFRGTLRQIRDGLIFESGADDPQTDDTSTKPLRLQMNSGLGTVPGDSIGRELILGLRPEHIVEASVLETAPGNVVEAITEAVERVGSEAYLHVRHGNDVFAARVRAATSALSYQRVTLAFDLRGAHLFDAKTGNRIGT